MTDARNWCPTYLRAEVQRGDDIVATAVIRLSSDAAVVIMDSPLTPGDDVYLRLYPRLSLDAPAISRGKITRVAEHPHRRGLQEILDPPIPHAQIELIERPGEIGAFIEREMDAQGEDRRIALVDDEPTTLWMLQSVVRTIGLEAICIFDPVAATNVLVESAPRLVILDLNMPDLPGRDLCLRLKEDPRTRHLPIVFLSAEPPEAIAAAAREANADGWLEKGCDLADIVAEIRKHVKL